jgi:hypothetical protein
MVQNDLKMNITQDGPIGPFRHERVKKFCRNNFFIFQLQRYQKYNRKFYKIIAEFFDDFFVKKIRPSYLWLAIASQDVLQSEN